MEPISALLPFINLLRPTKSPHLLVYLAGTICVYLFVNAGAPELANYLFHLPIYVILTIAMILSFFYKPPEISKYLVPKDTGDNAPDDPSDDEAQEVDHQFKFARAFCLVTGIIALYIFASNYDEDRGSITFVTYGIILLHILIFLFYMVFRVLREEGMQRFAIYQIGLITGVVVIALSLSYASVETFAPVGEGPEPADWARNNLMFYAAIWGVYTLFWLGRLRHFIKINVVEPG